MAKNKKLWLIVGAVCLLVCLGVVLAMCGGRSSSGNNGDADTAAYTIEVQTSAGIGLADIGIYVYEDSTQRELAAFIRTDETGVATFTDTVRDTYVAVLSDVPASFVAEEYYALTGLQTQIVLQTAQMSEEVMQTLTYKLGDTMMDFSVTGPDGTVYTLSELFEGKQAVVLNFFYNNCQPCLSEFPYLQQAYEKYSDHIAVLAMNPVDTDGAAIAALQKELGLTFPMVSCDAEWERIMQLSAYPTTVIIDRYGVISLIHTGTIKDAQTFEEMFSYFASENYEQTVVEDMEDIVTEQEEGSKSNPTEVAGETSFEVTVEPGKVVYNDIYKVFGVYLQIRSENAYVIYDGDTYYPKNGLVSVLISAPDTRTPAQVGFGNSGKETETFKVALVTPAGTQGNPYKLSIGEFETKVAAGNDQGVFYTYKATEDGTLTLQCLSATSGVKYGYFLYNLDSGAMRNLEGDAVTDNSGATTVSVQVKKGQTVQVCISTLPDEKNTYPAGTFKFSAVFTSHEIKEEEVIPTTTYSVTVVDDSNTPVPNVNIQLDVDGTATPFATDKNGVATIQLPTGSYKGTLIVPEGYTAPSNVIEVSEGAPNVTVRLTKIVITTADYTVKVLGPAGEAVANVMVVIGDKLLYTDENGEATVNLEIAEHSVSIMVPSSYSGENSYSFAQGATQLTINLGYALGSQQNPYVVTEYPFNTASIAKNGGEIYCLFHFDGVQALTIEDEDAYIRIDSTTYGADDDGVVTVLLEELSSPATMVIGNSGSKKESYTVKAVYPVGSLQNPEVRTSAGSFGQVKLAAGDADGYYYSFTPAQAGTYNIRVQQTPKVDYDISLTTQTASALLSESDVDKNVSIHAAAGEQILIHVYACADAETGEYPAATMRLTSTFTADPEPSEPGPGEPDPSVPGTSVPESSVPESSVPESSVPESSVPESSVPESSVPESSVPESSVPESSEPETEYTYNYTVTVTDVFGAGQEEIAVLFKQGGILVGMAATDEDGRAEYGTNTAGNCTVELAFAEGEECYYDRNAVTLTPERPNLTIKLADLPDAEDATNLYIINDAGAYNLYLGGTYVELSAGKSYYSAENGGNCFFVFSPTKEGTYRITANNPNVVLSYWGASTNYISYQYSSTDEGEENSITESISSSMAKNVLIIIGVKVTEGVEGTVLNIARIGDASLSEGELPYDDTWMQQFADQTHTSCGAWTAGANLTYIDINAATGTYKLYYDEANGYYRLNDANGPVIMVDLNSTRYVSLYQIIKGFGAGGGTNVQKYFYNKDGSFDRKEKYTDVLIEYFDCAGITGTNIRGYHPLTKELAYILQNGGSRWWEDGSGEQLEGLVNANAEYVWLFLCCYNP